MNVDAVKEYLLANPGLGVSVTSLIAMVLWVVAWSVWPRSKLLAICVVVLSLPVISAGMAWFTLLT